MLFPEIFTYDVGAQCMPVTSFFLNLGMSADSVINMTTSCPYILK